MAERCIENSTYIRRGGQVGAHVQLLSLSERITVLQGRHCSRYHHGIDLSRHVGGQLVGDTDDGEA